MKGSSPRSTTPRHVPQRTCIACRQVLVKRELIRVVRTPAGNIEVDTTGKKAGRGAYVHPVRQCWALALKGSRLEHALKGRLTKADREQLLSFVEDIPEGAN